MKNHKPKMSIGAWCIWLFCRSVAILPHWFQFHVLARLCYAVMRYVVRYRRTLIIKQLTECFPEKSEAEITAICNEFYHNLSEIIICTMTLAGISEQERRSAVKFNIPDSVREAVKGRHHVLLASHYGFWEYAQFVGLSLPGFCEIGAYHPLSSKVWDELYFYLRSFEDVIPVASNNYLRYFIQHRTSGVNGKPMMLGMFSDQNAPPTGDAHWYDFLGRKTLFFDGGQQLALRFGLPVTYLRMRRTSAGRYEAEVILIHDGQEQVGEYEIMERYVRLLEEDIRRDPARWMWSHRRWKYTLNEKTGEAVYHPRG
ncbi:MAG: lysophospholipid acyltransferase family protein [Alistipes sp.]|nr:lysophospholipid acyltransferase family protein [Alistipes sp.]